MNGINIQNVRIKARKMVKPPITLSDLAKETGINMGKLSMFIHKNLDISEEEAKKVYEALLAKKLVKTP